MMANKTIEDMTPRFLAMLLGIVKAMVPGLKVTIIISEDTDAEVNYRMASTEPRQFTAKTIANLHSKLNKKEPEVTRAGGDYSVEVECDVKAMLTTNASADVSFNDIKVLAFPDCPIPGLKVPTGHLTPAGLNIASAILAHGLISNIHYGHQMKIRDSAEHLRYVIEILEARFVDQVQVECKSNLEDF